MNRYNCILIAAVALLAVLPSSAAANHPATGAGNDQIANPVVLGEPDASFTESNASPPASTQTGEPLTPTGSGSCAGATMGRTLWYRVTGTGGPITVSTRRSDFDTVLAVYRTADGSFVDCNDDVSDDILQSEFLFASVAGAGYLVQVGGFVDSAGTPASGSVGIDVFRPAANDNRANAQTVSTGTATTGDNTGATVEAGEVTACEGSPYGKTVWFRWVAPATGDAVFAANSAGIDTVLAAYLGGGGAPVGCSDDAVGSGTSSRLPRRVQAGETYFIQVGGFGAGQAADHGTFSFAVEFTEDLDFDDDGSSRPADCNDSNPSIRPGARDVVNGVDDDCDGTVDPDRDGDGFARAPVGRDCNDDNRNVNPGAVDVPGNRVDENCNGMLVQFSRIRAVVNLRGLAGSVFQVRGFVVQNVPRGARVRVRCRTPRGRSCGKASRTALATPAGRIEARTARTVHIRLRRVFTPGSVITVRITKSNYIGFYQRLRIRRGTRPKRSRRLCINPGSLKPRPTCPGIR